MPIFYIQYQAVPTPGSEEFETAGGAFVNCWVKVDSAHEAQDQASAALKEGGWTILAVEEECREVTELYYSENDEGLEHFRQAVVDGECYVFYQWPLEPQEGDDVH
jgi:hypothetical protein